MFFGSHVSIAGGLELAPERAASVGCEVLQIFSRSPRGGKPPKLAPSTIKAYQDNCKKYNIKESYIHAPYYINLASKTPRIRWGSISVLKEELERGSALGVSYLMTHLGSAKDYGRKKSIEKVIRAIIHVLKDYQGSTQFLLEQSAGAGGEDGIIGGKLEELNYIMSNVNSQLSTVANRCAVCIDTCHAFAMGYDLRTKKSVNDFVKKIDSTIGLKNLKLWHFNDSKFGLGEHKDRHEHIGKGKIGKEGFKALVNHPKLKNINAILETPKDKTGQLDKMNLKLLRNFK
jgi:deoxyribonuclease IV